MLAFADGHDGVASLDELRCLGFSDGEIRARVRSGHLVPEHRGVFMVARQRISGRGHLRAALLAGGDDAFLSHRSAAAVYRLRSINRFAIHLTRPGATRRSRDNLIIHRSTLLHPDDVRVYEGLRVSSIARMLIDLTAAGEPRGELQRLITEADRRDLLQIDRLKATLTRHAGRPGAATLTTVLGDYVWTPRDKSTLERDFAQFIAADPELPTPLRNITLGPYEIDVYWPGQRLAVELDGRTYHQAVKDRDRDNAKDIWLAKHGLWAIRIRDFRFEHDKPGILRDLHELLGLATRAA